MEKFCHDLEDIATVEAPPSFLGRFLIAVIAPGAKKKKEKEAVKPQNEGPSAPAASELHHSK